MRGTFTISQIRWSVPHFNGGLYALLIRAKTDVLSPVLGAPADFVVLDLNRLDRDAIMAVDPLQLQFARGKPTGVDLTAIEQGLRGMYRAGVKQFGRLERAWAPLAGRWGMV